MAIRKRQRQRPAELILRGLEQALAVAEGRAKPARVHVVRVPAIDVKALRAKLDMSQEEFARHFALPLANVRNWEQGRTEPTGPARTLLLIIDREPKAALRAIKQAAA